MAILFHGFEIHAAMVFLVAVIIVSLALAAISFAKAEKVYKATNPPGLPALVTDSTIPSGDIPVITMLAATFHMSDFQIIPAQAMKGEPVNVSFAVTNTDCANRYYKADLRVNGRVVGTRPVSLAPGATKLASFTVVETNSGVHEVEAGGFKGQFVILEPSVVSAVPGADNQRTEKTAASNSPTVSHFSSDDSRRRLQPTLGGVAVIDEEIALAPDASQEANFASTIEKHLVDETERPEVFEPEMGDLEAGCSLALLTGETCVEQEEVLNEDDASPSIGLQSIIDKVADCIEYGLDKGSDGMIFPIDKIVDGCTAIRKMAANSKVNKRHYI